jgi:hypothetical protein
LANHHQCAISVESFRTPYEDEHILLSQVDNRDVRNFGHREDGLIPRDERAEVDITDSRDELPYAKDVVGLRGQLYRNIGNRTRRDKLSNSVHEVERDFVEFPFGFSELVCQRVIPDFEFPTSPVE